MPCFRAGIALFRGGKTLARKAKNIHQPETKANCMMVSVIGFGLAFRIDLEDVLVSAELMYHIRQST